MTVDCVHLWQEILYIYNIPIMNLYYLNCKAAGEPPITSEASLRARDAFCSPSAAITLALASRAASASAAMALCNCTGSRTSLLKSETITYISTRSTLIPHASVASSNCSWKKLNEIQK
ncbi:hypothetical protein FF38_06748 [Lucilia cuprina]|uniref:Uncharacterized protein n=1 Tax=Lucilia cuprina TaxID=7375 RepID=A0A0L0C9A6_LUCCU|nr:hypothetical protein FF38_06748 [Lucilia cuprina]